MPLDTSSLFGPTPPSGVTRGLRFFGDALDAVMQRRQQKQLADEQMRQQEEISRRAGERDWARIIQQGEQNDLSRQLMEQERDERRVDRDLDRDVRMHTGDVTAINASAALAGKEGGLAIAQDIERRGAELRKRIEDAKAARAAAQPPPRPERIPLSRVAGLMDPLSFMTGQDPGWGPETQPQDVQPPPVQAPPIPQQQPVMDPADAAVGLAGDRARPPAPQAAAPASAPPAKPSIYAGLTPEARTARFEARLKERGYSSRNLGPLAREAYKLALSGYEGSDAPDAANKAIDNIAAAVALDEANKREAERAKTAAEKGDVNEREKILARAHREFQAHLEKNKFPAAAEAQEQFTQMRKMGELAGKKDGAGAARIFMGQFIKYAQGQSGVINQGDIELFWQQMGSKFARTEDALAQALEGTLGEEKRRIALKAIKAMEANVMARTSRIYEGAAKLVAPYEQYDGWGTRMLQSYFGRGLPAAGATGAGAPAAGSGAPTAPARGTGAPATPAKPAPALTPAERKRWQSVELE